MTPQEEQMLLAQILKQQGGGLQAPPVSLMPPSANTNPYGGGAIGNPYNPPAPAAGPAPDTRYAAAAADTTGQESGIAQQQRMAEALMAQSQKSPDLISAGRVSHAGASPMSALAQGISGWGAGKASKNAREGSKALEKALAKKAEAAGSIAQSEAEAAAAEAERKAKLDAEKALLEAAKFAETKSKNATDAAHKRSVLANTVAQMNQSAASDSVEMIDKDGNTIEAWMTPEGPVSATGKVDERVWSRRQKPVAGAEGEVALEDLTPDKRRQKIISDLPSAGERDRATLLLSTGEQLSQLMGTGNSLLASGSDPSRWKSFAGDAARVIAPEALEDASSNMANELAYTDEEINFIGGLENAVGDLRKSRTGANVTKIETELGKNWDPTVKGITFPERVRRASELQKFVNNKLKSTGGIEGFEVIQPFDPSAPKEPIQVGPAPVAEASPTAALDAEEEALYQQFPNLRP